MSKNHFKSNDYDSIIEDAFSPRLGDDAMETKECQRLSEHSTGISLRVSVIFLLLLIRVTMESTPILG